MEVFSNTDYRGRCDDVLHIAGTDDDGIDVSVYFHNYVCGGIDATFRYSVADGAVTLDGIETDRVVAPSDALTAAGDFDVYSDYSLDERSFGVSEGEQISIVAVRVVDGDIVFKIVNPDGEAGWIGNEGGFVNGRGTLLYETQLAG